MQSPAADIAEVIEDLLAPVVPYISFQPDKPDAVITVYTAGGQGRDSTIDYERPIVQVRSRGAQDGYEEAYAALKEVSDTIHGLTAYETSTSRIIQILQVGDIYEDPYDSNMRPSLVSTFLIHRTRR